MPLQTPLASEHRKLHAKMVDFAGWEMPVHYTGVIDEHRAVRQAAGIFDVSHMGEIELSGRGALAFAQHLTVNDIGKLADHTAQYSILCNEQGNVIDDIIVYRYSSERILFVVNASNRAKDYEWICQHQPAHVAVRDVSDHWALIALQGPKSADILSSISTIDLNHMPSFTFQPATVAEQKECVVARTGYTGELGCEIFCPPSAAIAIWQALLEKGASHGLQPVGLGARDTLRLEMAYSLYGHELTEDINPLEAGLSWVVKLNVQDDFIGKQALMNLQRQGLKRKLVGFRMLDPGIPRQGYAIASRGEHVGIVTSGTMSPSLAYALGLGFVPNALAALETKFSIDIRGTLREAVAVKIPFYKKNS